MKKLFFIIIAAIIITGCENNVIEIDTVIKPRMTMVEHLIAVEYKLGDLIVLDDWYGLNGAQELFLSENSKKLEAQLHVKVGDAGFSSDGFYYTIGNIEVKTDPVSWNTLMKYSDSIPDLKWIKRNGEKMPTTSDSSIKKDTNKL